MTRRQTAAVPDLTADYTAQGRPAPMTRQQVHLAARRHFNTTRASMGAYRAWMTEGGHTVAVQVERDMRAAVIGTVR